MIDLESFELWGHIAPWVERGIGFRGLSITGDHDMLRCLIST